MSNYSTEQERFWVGEFGDAYLQRNDGEGFVNSNLMLFAAILKRAVGVRSILELGCNIGLNLQALQRMNGGLQLAGVEINPRAAAIARQKTGARVTEGTIIAPLALQETFDLTFTKTVLIHINPDCLPAVYENLYRLSHRYILICEHYNPSPVATVYRGNDDKLFKRDFAGELLTRYPLRLVDYGFAYHRDPHYAFQDDPTWFLLEK